MNAPPSIRSYVGYIKQEIVNASEQEDKIWDMIQQSDQIWICTSLIGESTTLYYRLLKQAIKENVKHKYIFNLTNRRAFVYQLMSVYADGPQLM
jgi:hypothetical protein